ncbi:MAG TPA: hypothetical protein DCQ04_03995 [Actinobacteria bacterium]|nr:hypothetical protein [Actinomycetota bacterium]
MYGFTMTTITRKIHLVDIENLCGTPRPSRRLVQEVRDRYINFVPLGTHDHVVLACNHGACLDVGLGWPGPRLLVRSGHDGADQALLDVLADEGIEVRFTGVVIASGDGIFTEAAARLAQAGLEVLVVSRIAALSKRLTLAAHRIVVFPWPDLAVEAA